MLSLRRRVSLRPTAKRSNLRCLRPHGLQEPFPGLSLVRNPGGGYAGPPPEMQLRTASCFAKAFSFEAVLVCTRLCLSLIRSSGTILSNKTLELLYGLAAPISR